jgi:phosphoglycolate phosphatase-like HAD superfamily hydrolase
MSARVPPSPWVEVRGVLFDVDGTLYDQRRLRLLMAADLARFALVKGTGALEVWRAILCFRRTREELRALGRPPGSLAELQYAEAARRVGLPEVRLRAIIEEWMLGRPLRHLAGCRRPGAAELLHSLRRRGLSVGVFSDYPADSKLSALGLAEYVSVSMCATDGEVNAFKPHPRGLACACEKWGLRPAEVLYVGDRADVDAPAAAALGMPCAILGRWGSFEDLRRTLGG